METIAGGKANGEVHNYSGVVGTDELGFAGLSLRVTWLSTASLEWIKGTLEAVARFTLRIRDVISRQSPCDDACLPILSSRLTVAQLDDRQST